MISVYGNLSLNVGNFLTFICPLKKPTKCEPKDIKVFLSETLFNIDKQFTEFVQNKFMTVTSWLVMVNGRIFKAVEDSDKNLESLVSKRSAIIIEGIEHCQAIK